MNLNPEWDSVHRPSEKLKPLGIIGPASSLPLEPLIQCIYVLFEGFEGLYWALMTFYLTIMTPKVARFRNCGIFDAEVATT